MRLLVLLLVFLFASAPADAQRRRHHSFAKQGDVALVAQVNGLSVQAFTPSLGGLGLRYRLADQTVLGIGFGLNNQEIESEREDTRPVDEVRDRGSRNMGGGIWLEQHFGSRRRTVSPFIGGGVYGNLRSNYDETIRPREVCEGDECSIETQRQSSETKWAEFGGGLLIGAEVRLGQGVTLGGAYGVGVSYIDYSTEFENDRLDGETDAGTITGETLSIRSESPRLNVSIYF